MANKKLGIDVEINYPVAKEIKNDLEAAIKKIDAGVEVKVTADNSSLKTMRSEITKFLNNSKFEIELKFDTSKAMANLKEVRQNVDSLIKAVGQDIEINFTGVAQQAKDIKEVSASIDSVTKKQKQSDSAKMSGLREIMSTQKELNSLQTKQASAGIEEQKVYGKRIQDVKKHLTDLKAEFKGDASSSFMIENVEAIGKFNVELMQAKQNQKETAQGLKEYTALLNEEYRIEKQIQSAGEQQSKLLTEQADKVRDRQSALLEEYNLFQKLTAGQVEKLNYLRQENDFQLNNSKLKREDAALAKKQSEAYRSLKSDLTEIHKIQLKVNELQAKADKGVASAKEETTLNSLQQQLIVRKNLHDAILNEEKAQGHITSEIEDSLNSLSDQHTKQASIAQETANLNADLQKTNSLYDDIESSISRVINLNRDLASAGERESSIIRDAITAEERKQNSIAETLQAQNRVNNAREEELATLRSTTAEQSQLNSARSQAKQVDTFNQNSTIGMFDPSTVYNEGKQAAMEIYSVVAELDKEMINIEKVANASQKEMDAFKGNIFSFATDVGKSAAEYSTSVERWVTAGYELSDGIAMAKESTMGAFVGNIDESAMVDYMSVPLIAYKDSALESADVLNTMNEVANQNAIEMDDLGQAYKRAANTSSSAGTTFSELTGMITAAQEATRLGGESIGTSIKAMDINFSKIASRITKGDNDKFDYFKNLGVDIVDANGELRSTYDIMGDLSGIWDTLSSEQQSIATFYGAGKQHATAMQGIVRNWEVVTKSTGEANEQMSLFDKESGSAYQEFAKQQGSVEYAVAGLKNAWAEFIYEISGGREGVAAVVAQLQELVEVGISLAKNDGFMKFAGMFLKATMWLTANAAINKVFTTLTLGAKSTIGFFNPLSKGAGTTAKAVGKVAEGAAKSATSVGGLAKVFGLAKGAIGKFIPVVGGVLAVLSILDILGIDVAGTFRDIMDGTFMMNGALKEYQETVKETSASIENNPLLNEEYDEVNALLEKYKELNKEKQKETDKKNETKKKNGKEEDSKNWYYEAEFTALQEEFNATAEALDLDLQITFNDYDHIKQQLNELEKQKNKLEADSAQELVADIRKRNELPSNPKTYESDFENSKKKVKAEIASTPQKGGGLPNVKEVEEAMEEYTRMSDKFTERFAGEEFKQASEAREQLIKDSKITRDELLKIHESLNPQDLGVDGSFFAAQELLPSVVELSDKSKAFEEIKKQIAETGAITEEQKEILAGLAPEYGLLQSQIEIWDESTRKSVLEAINGQQELDAETSKSLDSRIAALLAYSGMEEEEINGTMERLKGSSSEMISMMGELGETGRLFMGVSEEAIAVYGDEWDTVMIRMQEGIEKLPSEKITEYKLLTDDGLFNWEVLDAVFALPDSITTKYELIDENGLPRVEKIVEMFDEIPDETITKYKLENSDGSINIEKLAKTLSELPEEEVVEFFATSTGFDPTAESVVKKTKEIGGQNPTVEITGDDSPFNLKHDGVKSKIGRLDETVAIPDINANDIPFGTKSKGVLDKIGILDITTGTPKFDADSSQFQKVNDDVDAKVNKKRESTTTFKAVMSGAWDVVKKLTGLQSIGISAPNIGGSLGIGTSQSVGVSDSQSVQQATSNSTTSNKNYKKDYNKNYDDDKDPAKVDGSVWRYWAKELYKGIPLENSMEELNKSITNADENYTQLISLYKQQIKQVDKQIAYEKDMKTAQQSEMNSLLSQLRKQGFKTSGNQVTNLGITKNMSGDKAEKATDLLGQWETLYRALDTTNDKIKDLNQDKLDIKGKITDAEESKKEEAIEKELESIEKTLKRTEGLLTAIENDTSLFNNKLGMISDTDFELKMSITEEGSNKASQNIKTLTDEFNRLSKTSVKYEENAGEIQDNLESLKSEILDNADAIIEYRNALQELELQRMAEDFDKFATTIESNLNNISNNIDNLKDGLVSGQDLGDLASSSLLGLDFTRKTGLEKQYEQRLQLEAELNEALDGFAKKNVDRAKGVANATLTIEKNKYSELLKLANGYSNGKVESVSVSSPNVGIGKTKQDTSKDKNYQSWLNNLKSINEKYVKAYNSMVSKYDLAMNKAQTKSEKEAISNAMIIDQLKLQESIYQSMIDSNNKAIKQTESLLSDSSLTTEQRQELLDSLETYKQSNVDSQNSIKDSIQSRFDLEFELLDELTEKASEYSSELSNMMDIAEALNSGKGVMDELYKSLFQSKINEYANATSIIEDLVKEQSKFTEGSFEWNIIQDKVEEVQESLSGLTIDILNANKDILGSQMDIIQEASEKMSLGGLSADNYDKYKDAWMDGVEKELELEKLRIKLSSLEDKTLQGKLELMDRQEKLSRAELEYVDKQLEAAALQEKLNNIAGERNVQTLTKDDKGRWQWDYLADQTEYDSTKEELDDIKLELEKYREEQRRAYVDQMNEIIGNVKDGEYKDVGELIKDIENVNEMYDDIIKDINGMSLYDTDKIIGAYQDYLNNNNNIIKETNGGKGFSDSVNAIGSKFEQSFLNVTTGLSKIIADELRKALDISPSTNERGIVIEHQTLEFPNVTDSNGLEEAFRELPQIAKQISTNK